MKYCFKCRTEWEGMTQPGARESCRNCGQDLHACRNCRFYDPHKSRQCMVDGDEVVTDKERGNFCEEFQFADHPSRRKDPGDGDKRSRTAWNDLFEK